MLAVLCTDGMIAVEYIVGTVTKGEVPSSQICYHLITPTQNVLLG